MFGKGRETGEFHDVLGAFPIHGVPVPSYSFQNSPITIDMSQKLFVIQIERPFVRHPVFDKPQAHPKSGMR